MTMRGTLLLWMCILALAAYAWITAGPQSRVQKRTLPAAAGHAPLLRFDVAAVDGVDITGPTGVIRLRRQGTAWRRARGAPLPAPEGVDALLETLADIRPLATIASAPVDLESFGLDPPRSRIAISLGPERSPLTLVLGDRNPAWTGVYALASSAPDQVVLLGALILWEVDKISRAARQDRDPPSPPERHGDGARIIDNAVG